MKRKKRTKERKDKKPVYPRFWLNVMSDTQYLAFECREPVLSKAEFVKCRREESFPNNYSIPLNLSQVENLLFNSDEDVYIHTNVSKWLISHPPFRKKLSIEIETCKANASEWSIKLERARIKRSIDHWNRRVLEAKDRSLMLLRLQSELLKT